MSHDENLHVWFSWLFSQSKGFQHTPLMHGPLLFHLTALSYWFFGSSDFTARLPEALSSILTVILLWKWRRYLGRAGTLIAAGLMVISPFMLYYGRYARNEAFVALFGVLTLYAILRYFETGKARYLVLLTVATALHFTAKETAFIYTAQAMLFLAAYLINRVTKHPWRRNKRLINPFFVTLTVGVILVGVILGVMAFNKAQLASDASQTAEPILPGQLPAESAGIIGPLSATTILILAAGVIFLATAILLILGYGWDNLRRERSFTMLILLGTFVLPQLAAFPVSALGWDPLAYQFTWPGWNLAALWAQGPVRTGVVFVIMCLITLILGLFWNYKRWLGYTALFWVIYIFFFTSVFSNWQGFFTGSVGSLGYWLVQQGVHRGDQPWYYYLLVQIPVYEFLPALGVALAAYLGLRRKSPAPLYIDETFQPLDEIPVEQPVNPSNDNAATEKLPPDGNLTFPLLLWWAISSLLAYTIAGEKMPWLTVHIALPFILLTGWGLGQLIERMDWSGFRNRRSALATVLLVTFFLGLAGIIVIPLGANPPFQGKTIEQLTATGRFLFSVIVVLLSAGGLVYIFKGWNWRSPVRAALLVFFALAAVLTGRSAYRASFINYNDATEYLAYAHGGNGIQEVMDQVQLISSRITGEKTLQIAYDNNMPKQGLTWSFKWYFRNYPNAFSFDVPDETLSEVPVILVDINNFDEIKPIVRDDYYQLDYIRMVWPNQDYFALTWPRLRDIMIDPAMREAIFQIWLNRDYSDYARVTGKGNLTLSTWQPSDRMRFYIRRDLAAQIWDYAIYQPAALQPDPYEKGTISLSADQIIGADGEMNAPRGIAIHPDGSLLVADSRNNRLLHFDAEGNILQTFGETSPGCPYDQLPPADVPLGTFCEPWAAAYSPDGRWMYVADTWNHRIQKLTAEGMPVKAWGTAVYNPVSSEPYGLWGPRGVAVDTDGRLLVADTGNKRIVIYDQEGNFISQFGGGGLAPGQLEEPVGLAFDSQGQLYVADTWNQRIQVFFPSGDSFAPSSEWTINGWNDETLNNKPYLAVDVLGNVFATDPEGFRVLQFTSIGEFIRTWGSHGTGIENFGLASGIAVDSQGRVWVSDASNNRLMRFTLP